jgi:hypothetical protein
VVRDAELGRRLADALVQVTLTSGEQRWIYIHIEVQGQRDADFAQRMFTYNYRLFDRYACPIASLAVLADDDDGWKPDHYGFEVLGCKHHIQFPVVKLSELADQTEALDTTATPLRWSPPPTCAPGKPVTTRKPAIRRSGPWFACSISRAGNGNGFSTCSPCWTG